MNDKISGIYYIKNKINSKLYIGKSDDIHRRWREHKTDLTNNRHFNIHLQRSWNKYGEQNFEFRIIDICDSEIVYEREKYWIEKYNSLSNGYNQTLGGEGCEGYKHHSSAIKKMSIIQSERFKDKSERKKLSLAHKFESVHILQIDFDGNIVKEWQSKNWASKSLNITEHGISQSLDHMKNKTYKGFIWFRKDEYPSDFDVKSFLSNKRKGTKRKINQKDLQGTIVKTWDSIVDASLNGFSKSCISKCCRNELISHRGFIWEYSEQ